MKAAGLARRAWHPLLRPLSVPPCAFGHATHGQAHTGASRRRAAPGSQFVKALRAASASRLAPRSNRLRCSPAIVRLPGVGRGCFFISAVVQFAAQFSVSSPRSSNPGAPRPSLHSQARCARSRRQSFLPRLARSPDPSCTPPNAAQPFARADSHRRGTWPARRFRSSSASRAKRHTGVCRSAQTLSRIESRRPCSARLASAASAVVSATVCFRSRHSWSGSHWRFAPPRCAGQSVRQGAARRFGLAPGPSKQPPAVLASNRAPSWCR